MPLSGINGVAFEPMRRLAAAVDRQMHPTRFLTGVALAFALMMCGLGTIATATATRQYLSMRRTDFAVRMALGASPSSIRRVVSAGALIPVASGMLLGLPLAYFVAGLIASYRFGVEGSSPVSYLAAMSIIMLGSVMAIAPLALRAGRVSPAEVLRTL
jgi:ABC-type antimicrobial peptide transport system permease subunit